MNGAFSWAGWAEFGQLLMSLTSAAALGVVRAAPELAASVCPSPGGALDHLATADRASGRCRRSLRPNWGGAWRTDKLFEGPGIHQLDGPAFGEGFGIGREVSGGDHEAPDSTFCGHDTVQLPDNRHAHLVGAPLLALHQVLVLAEEQLQVHAAVGASTPALHYLVALLPECLRHQAFKLCPVELGH